MEIQKINDNITLFVCLIKNNINARIYFVFNASIESFVEYQLGGKIVEHKNYYSGNIFSFDKNVNVLDQTVLFSKKPTHHLIFTRALEYFNNVNRKNFIKIKENAFNKNLQVDKDIEASTRKCGATNTRTSDVVLADLLGSATSSVDDIMSNGFIALDKERLEKLPTKMKNLRIHPFYTAKSICRKNELVYPKHPVCGLIDGEKMYLRKFCQRLKTDKGWYMEGKLLKTENRGVNNVDTTGYKHRIVLKTVRPYRIVNEKKLYAEFQTVPIRIKGLKQGPMDYFSNNFIPEDCVYVLCDSNLCEMLGVKYSECVIGLRKGRRIIKGVFIYKKDSQFVYEMLDEYLYYMRNQKARGSLE